MNLFEQQVDDDKLHPNFKSLFDDNYREEQSILNSWVEDFPDRDGKFVKEFQTTFNSSFWEIYLFKLFKDMGFQFDWSFPSPDFAIEYEGVEFIVEATISSNAQNEPAEWENKGLLNKGELELKELNEMNRVSIIRLANSFQSKLSKYRDADRHRTCYKNLPHVKGKPFVMAIAPFEQPFHYLQYDRPIMALLYDYYVDEDAYTKNPEKYPDGPPGVSLNYVEKDNGSDIMLGMFNDERAKEVSAVLFNPQATNGKVLNISDRMSVCSHVWTTENGLKMTQNEKELIEDGLFVFHNPFAKHPLPKHIFDRERVCQVFMDKNTLYLERKFGSKHLSSRMIFSLNVRGDKED